MPETVMLLKALTPEARVCLNGPTFQIPYFPFRVGRESRINDTPAPLDSRRRPDSAPHNDLYLLETGPLMNVSREHFQIELRDDGFYLVDRGSTCGTLVEGITVGKNKAGGETMLESGDVIIVGTSSSRLIFKFMGSR